MSVLSVGERAVAEGECVLRGRHQWGQMVGGERRCRWCEMPEGYFLSAPSPSRTAMMVYAQPRVERVARPVPEPCVCMDPAPERSRGLSATWLLVVAVLVAVLTVRIGVLL